MIYERKAKTWQKPKEDHPWRRYANKLRKKAEESEKENPKKIKAIRIFIQELSESWDSIEVYTTAYGKEDRFLLSDLPQSKQAAWLAGILKRNYA